MVVALRKELKRLRAGAGAGSGAGSGSGGVDGPGYLDNDIYLDGHDELFCGGRSHAQLDSSVLSSSTSGGGDAGGSRRGARKSLIPPPGSRPGIGTGTGTGVRRDPGDVKKIRELEAALRDLQDGVRKRFPDSVSSLIHAAKLSDTEQAEITARDRFRPGLCSTVHCFDSLSFVLLLLFIVLLFVIMYHVLCSEYFWPVVYILLISLTMSSSL